MAGPGAIPVRIFGQERPAEPVSVVELEVRGSGPAFLALLEAATAEGLEVRKIHVHVERGGAS